MTGSAPIRFFLTCLVVGISGGLTLAWTTHRAPASPPVPHPSPTPQAVQSAAGAPVALSTSTPVRVIDALSIADVVPATGKFIAADLSQMVLTLYRDGAAIATYPIIAKGRPGTPDETPSGYYQVLSKEYNHYIKRSGIYMPYSVQFYGNYFIHAPPFYSDGRFLPGEYSGGCIRLSFADAEQVYTFAEGQTGVFVYDPKPAKELPSLALRDLPRPAVSAVSYVVADADTRDVFLEKNASDSHPISSLTKLMTALVAHETLTLGNMVVVPHDTLPATAGAGQPYDIFALDDLLYALLLDTKHNIATLIAGTYGTADFVRWMNTTATALNMQSTHFVDAGGISPRNTASAEDMYRLATYLENRKSFILNITRTPETKLVAATGGTYHLTNPLSFSGRSDFIGGHAGTVEEAQGAMVSLFSIPVHGAERKVAITVLGSSQAEADVSTLVDWITRSVRGGANLGAAACVVCAHPSYRKISE